MCSVLGLGCVTGRLVGRHCDSSVLVGRRYDFAKKEKRIASFPRMNAWSCRTLWWLVGTQE